MQHVQKLFEQENDSLWVCGRIMSGVEANMWIVNAPFKFAFHETRIKIQ